MTSLRDILEAQKEFESLFVEFDKLSDPLYLDDTADYLATSLAEEAFEFRREFNWKKHINRRKLHNRDKQLEEAIDCFTFSLNLLLVLGLTAEEVSELYFLKNKINWDKQVDEGNPKAIARIAERA